MGDSFVMNRIMNSNGSQVFWCKVFMMEAKWALKRDTGTRDLTAKIYDQHGLSAPPVSFHLLLRTSRLCLHASHSLPFNPDTPNLFSFVRAVMLYCFNGETIPNCMIVSGADPSGCPPSGPRADQRVSETNYLLNQLFKAIGFVF